MKLDPRAYYDEFSLSYNRRRHHGYHALVDEIEAAAVSARPAQRILEAGCGTGLVMERLRASGATALFGIDLSAGMLTVAREQHNAVAQASVTALPFADASFDVAYSFKVLAHVPDIQQAVAEIARVVRPGGTMVLEFYNRSSIRGLRWKLKNLFGGESTGQRQRETELFTRYDNLQETLSYLPGNVRLEAVRGAILVTPAAAALRVPGLAAILALIERRVAASRLARYSGFLILVLRRL